MEYITRNEIRSALIYALECNTALTTVASDLTRNPEMEPFIPEECPALLISFGTEDLTPLVSQDEHSLPVTLTLYTTTGAGDGSTPDDLFQACAVAIGANPTWGGFADGTSSPIVDTSDIYQAGDVLANGTLQFTIHYTTASGSLTSTPVVATASPSALRPGATVQTTAAELITMAGTGTLTPGQSYTFEFHTRHILNHDYATVHVGTAENLTVTARSASQLYPEAYSALHPDDIIRYTIDKARLHPFYDVPGFSGAITYRECPVTNVRAWHDWRYCGIAVGLPDPVSYPGIYYSNNVTWTDPASDMKIVPTITPGGDIYSVEIGYKLGNQVPMVVFLGTTQKVVIDTDQDDICFNGSCNDIYVAPCSSLLAHGSCQGLNVESSSGGIRLRGETLNLTIGPGGSADFMGNVTGCQIMAGYAPPAPLDGDRTGELIGYPSGA